MNEHYSVTTNSPIYLSALITVFVSEKNRSTTTSRFVTYYTVNMFHNRKIQCTSTENCFNSLTGNFNALYNL